MPPRSARRRAAGRASAAGGARLEPPAPRAGRPAACPACATQIRSPGSCVTSASSSPSQPTSAPAARPAGLVPPPSTCDRRRPRQSRRGAWLGETLCSHAASAAIIASRPCAERRSASMDEATAGGRQTHPCAGAVIDGGAASAGASALAARGTRHRRPCCRVAASERQPRLEDRLTGAPRARPSSGCGGTGRAPRRTAAASGSTLPGLQMPSGSNARAHAVHDRQVVGGEHLRHVARLVGADAVLAGDRAAGREAEVEDVARELCGLLGLARDRVVVAARAGAGCRRRRGRRCRRAGRTRSLQLARSRAAPPAGACAG